MKILFLARRFYPDIGGVEKHVLLLSKELQKKGHTITVISEMSTQENIERKKQFTINGIQVITINPGEDNWFKKFRIWKEMLQLNDVVKAADVVHCHDVFFWYLPFRFLYYTKPVYTTFHGYEGYPIKRGAIVSRKVSETLSWGNICIGEFMKKWYGTKPTIVSYGAVDVGSEKSEVISQKFKKDSAVFIGRLDDQTGILTYTKAVEMLLKDNPKFQFTIIGDGAYKNKINQKFTILGFKNNADSYLPKFHYAFISRYLAILEAFAAKRLVFAVYDNPVKEDYLKMTPYVKNIVIAKDANELKDKIAYYLNHPKEEKSKIDDAYRWVVKQTWDAMASNYLRLWKINE